MIPYNVFDQNSLAAALASLISQIEIIVTSSFTMTSAVTIPSGMTVTMRSAAGQTYTITRGVSATGNLITVSPDASLSISNLIIDGNYPVITNAGGSLIRNNGVLNQQGGSVIENNSNSGSGGGIYNSGLLTLDGGRVTGNKVTNGYSGAGVYNNIDAVFNMISGDIDNNSPVNPSGWCYGAGVWNFGEFNMYGGSIRDNNTGSGGATGGGVQNYSTFYMYGGSIRDNQSNGGAGVANERYFTMSGGEIIGNTVDVVYLTPSGGGGVLNGYSGVFTMNGGIIADNRVVGNSAYNRFGGGILNDRSGSQVILNGGIIAENHSDQDGGGIYNSGTLTFSGGNAIYGNTAGRNGGGLYQASALPLNIPTDTRFENNSAGLDGGAIYIPYANLANLNVASGTTFSGNSASAAYNRNPIDDPTYIEHIQGTQWTSPFTQGYNNYDISYTNGTRAAILNFEAIKTATGAPLSAGQFSFGIYDQSGALIAIATNDALGRIIFPAFTLEPEEHQLYMREITSSGNGWTTDSAVYPFTVIVTDEGIAQVIPPEAISSNTFNNTYAAPANVNLIATKTAVGAALPEGMFSFGVFDSNGSLVSSAYNGSNGNISFPAVSIDKPGMYYYTIRETTPSGGGWTTDGTVYPVVVTATDNGMGQLVTSVSYPEGQPVFVNTFEAIPPVYIPVNVTLRAKKTVCGGCLRAGMFRFGLFDAYCHEVAQATNDACGNITFPALTLNQPGVYNFTIRELTPSGCGWVTDKRVFAVTVTVTDSGNGKLTANLSYPNGYPHFINRRCCC
jgi:pilin isopeptide linkage protein